MRMYSSLHFFNIGLGVTLSQWDGADASRRIAFHAKARGCHGWTGWMKPRKPAF